MEKWNELCFILSESVSQNASEQIFELKVIQAFEKLGWSQFKKEIVVRESIQLGSSGRITPDIIIKNNETNLFVIEVKNPIADLKNPNFQDQLTSYMRMLRLNFGILIGNEIKIFVDGSLVNSNKSELIETIPFEVESISGLNFTKLFSKEFFSNENIEDYIQKKIEFIKENNAVEFLKNDISNSKYSDFLKTELRKYLLKDFNDNIVEKLFEDLKIEITNTSKTEFLKINHPRENTNKVVSNNENIDYELDKIYKKVPVWFKKPKQKNSQILMNFMNLRKNNSSVSFYDLENSCRNIENFRSSYQAMKTISDRNNAKVFEEINKTIYLWEPAKEFIEKEYKKYFG